MENAEIETETQERAVIQNSQVVLKARNANTTILSRHSINILVLLNKIPPERVQDFDKLYQYAKEIERFQQDKGDFMLLIDNLITAFIYRPITIQKSYSIDNYRKKRLWQSRKITKYLMLQMQPLNLKPPLLLPQSIVRIQNQLRYKHAQLASANS